MIITYISPQSTLSSLSALIGKEPNPVEAIVTKPYLYNKLQTTNNSKQYPHVYLVNISPTKQGEEGIMFNDQLYQNDSCSVSSIITNNSNQSIDHETMWDKLNLCQQYSVCSIGQFGYILTYVRTLGSRKLAILKLGNKVATINEAGTINVNPVINRHQ